MKRFPTMILTAAAALSLVACGGGEKSIAAGSASTESLLTLLPETAMGVLAFDIHAAMQTEAARKQLADPEAAAKIQEFIDKTGIDPREDLRLMVLGVSGASGNEPQGAAVVNLRYDRADLLARLKAEAKDEAEILEEDYQGYTLYLAQDPDDGKPVAGVFLDDSNIAIGQRAAVEQVIDLHRERGRNVLDSELLKPALDSANKKAMFWAAFAIPSGAIGQMTGENPMLESLKNLSALTVFFDYGRGALEAEIKALGGNQEQNDQISQMLMGFKAFGGMAAAQEPALGDVLNSIEVSSGSDFVKIAASIPDEVLEKLGKAAQDRVAGMMKPKAEEPEKKEEIK